MLEKGGEGRRGGGEKSKSGTEKGSELARDSQSLLCGLGQSLGAQPPFLEAAVIIK